MNCNYLGGMIFYFLLIGTYPLIAQDDFNYDEAKVPSYSLPDPFVTQAGEPVTTVHNWEFCRRPEIVRLFEDHVYGQVPRDFDAISFKLVHQDKSAMNGNAHLKEVDITVTRNDKDIKIRLILFVPTGRTSPAPAFLLINHRSHENIDPTRTVKMDFWPAENLISRGYAAATFHVEDVADDNNANFKADILQTLYPEQLEMANGMRGLGAWAWGAMRVMDYFERDPDIDASKAGVVGHSRGGKASLWTGAQDPRWALTVSNDSGCGGAAISRRKFGETVKRINTNFPYWFTDNFDKYNDNEDALPIDQHMLISSIAPRAVYVASAVEDEWADPKGEYLSLKLGTRVHRDIYNLPVNLPEKLPGTNQPTHLPYVGHHIRDGKHNLTAYDWTQFMDFADQLFTR
jgi:hypothetical protein